MNTTTKTEFDLPPSVMDRAEAIDNIIGKCLTLSVGLGRQIIDCSIQQEEEKVPVVITLLESLSLSQARLEHLCHQLEVLLYAVAPSNVNVREPR